MDDDRTRDLLRGRLEGLGVPYELFPCDPALADTPAFCAHYGFAPEDSANTIVVASRGDPPKYVACVTLAPYRLDVNRTIRHRLGVRRASFADAVATADLTGMEMGGVTVFGLPADLPIWVDSRVMERARIVLGGGSRSWKVIAGPAILRALPNVEIVEGLATDPSGATDPSASSDQPATTDAQATTDPSASSDQPATTDAQATTDPSAPTDASTPVLSRPVGPSTDPTGLRAQGDGTG
jgi:prolyl-tRNA editing enzyme YbaK/EbsC (Cys-tRNA(Pro) deacylase)